MPTLKPPAPTQRTLYRELGENVSDARRKAGITQLELARLLGRSRTFVTNLETGVNPVALHVLFDVAVILGTTPELLLPNAALPMSDVKLPSHYQRMVQDARKEQ